MSCIRRARVPVPRRQTPAGAEDTSSRDSLVIVIRCAQRRPERQPRLHPAPEWSCLRALHRTLNEGRSVNPGYTLGLGDAFREVGPRSTKAGASTPATLVLAFDLLQRRLRSTKAGASTPATRWRARGPETNRLIRSTKAGASTPATPTPGVKTRWMMFRCAQRRPERQPRLHTNPNDVIVPVANAQRRPERQPRLHLDTCPWRCSYPRARSTKAGASTPATPTPVACALNEAGASTPATPRRPSQRSTKAGASTPATHCRPAAVSVVERPF